MRKFILAWLFAAALTVPGAALAQSNDRNAPSPPDTLAGWAKGAELFNGLGNFHRKIATRSALAQKYFDQGMRFIWAFNHDEATRSFAKAAHDRSPLRQLLLGRRPYARPQLQHADDELAARSSRLAGGAKGGGKRSAGNSRRTRAHCGGGQALSRSGRSRSIQQQATAHRICRCDAAGRSAIPGDLDVQTMYAEALMNTNPWKLWKDDGTANPGTMEIVATLRRRARQGPAGIPAQTIITSMPSKRRSTPS